MLHALLVDDDVNFALGLAEVVGREGFGTKTANTLKEAKAEIAKSVPDVLLVDLHLPDGSGLDLFRELDGSPGAEIILITGQAMSDVQVRVTLTVYWSHLHYAGLNDTVPTAERCTVALPVILQLIAID